MFDLHRHDEYSTFDGYGKAVELAELAKNLGYKTLSTTNHGNTNGLIQTYDACKSIGIKPILGCEGYFLPKWKEKTRGYHLIVIAKNLVGYGNLNRLQFYGEKQKYYNPIWDFRALETYREGLICCSACVAGYSAKAIASGSLDKARKFFKRMQLIFGEDFYIEVQPYSVSNVGLQEKVNVESIRLAKELGIKCILTSDSHRGDKESLSTYLKLHEIAGHSAELVEETYKERYMPEKNEMARRFVRMHSGDFGKKEAISLAKQMYAALDEIEEKCEDCYLEKLSLVLPKLSGDSNRETKRKIVEGLKRRGKYIKQYLARCKEEFEVIEFHGFEDYFLIVADYVNWAKQRGVNVGPGRGSVCNSLVAYALGITEVDSLKFNLDFRRFLRKDKTSFPDIDIDFETSRRSEVIEYICKKYEGHAARICSYGLYKIDNLINDLAKVCGLPTTGDVDPEVVKQNKQTIAAIKSCVRKYEIERGVLDEEGLFSNVDAMLYNSQYDNIITHFCRLFKKVRYIGTHAAGVAVTGGNLLDYSALRLDKSGDVYTSYDLVDIEYVNVIKFDILGLKTMESIGNLRESTNVTPSYDDIVNDENLLEQFRLGKTDGIFQFEKQTARDILSEISCDCFEDVVAASSMNRPGPLSLGMPSIYAKNKVNIEEAKAAIWWDYTSTTYGTIIYQEQVMQICINIGGLSWGDADKVAKIMKGNALTAIAVRDKKNDTEYLRNKFVAGAIERGHTKEVALDLFDKMTSYTFNAGHATAYSLISMEEMFYKVYYPINYWFAKIKYAKDENERYRFCTLAVKDGAVLFLPHVNWSDTKTKLMKHDGEQTIQQGLSELKGVGEKAADFIIEERKKNGVFTSFDNFYDRCKSRTVTSRVISVLKEAGALEFSKAVYIKRVTKYNAALYSR